MQETILYKYINRYHNDKNHIVVLVYHVSIVTSGHGLLQEIGPMAILILTLNIYILCLSVSTLSSSNEVSGSV